LPLFGATLSRERVCVDRDRISGGGVTAGIDFALTLVAKLVDRATAEAIQLRLEYNPAPPFAVSGDPALMKDRMAESQAHRIASHVAAARMPPTAGSA
jgi:cyclohexyl-isocyanide hydratase